MSDIAYIIPIKITLKNKDESYYRIRNLQQIFISCLNQSINFNIYITETNDKKNDMLTSLISHYKVILNIKHNLIKNNSGNFDRAHTFNCTIKHFIGDEKILIMGDCDLPLNKTILNSIKKIKNKKYHFVSPYTYIEKLSKERTTSIYKNNSILNSLLINNKYKINPYSFSGGILIADRVIFEKMGMWFEVNGYGGEDRILDVIIENYYNTKKLRENKIYIHLWHPVTSSFCTRERLKFVEDYFGCRWVPNSKTIHEECKHKSCKFWEKIYKEQNKADLNKYYKI